MAEFLCYRTFIFRNPSVYSLTLVATSPFRGDITVCVVLTIAVIANFYMLPERELASPQAMTEGCACDKLGLSVRELASPKAMTEGWRKKH